MNTAEKTGHIGRKISKIRELRGMKQEALAFAIGVSQQTISNIENSETIDDDKLQEIAKALGVSQEAIKNFSEEAAINFFNSFYDNSFAHSQGTFNASHCTFNPLDKIIALFEEKEKLFERLLKAEQDKVAYLERLLDK
jgi:transcriptional regulator with XRE-family HTH domain